MWTTQKSFESSTLFFALMLKFSFALQFLNYKNKLKKNYLVTLHPICKKAVKVLFFRPVNLLET